VRVIIYNYLIGEVDDALVIKKVLDNASSHLITLTEFVNSKPPNTPNLRDYAAITADLLFQSSCSDSRSVEFHAFKSESSAFFRSVIGWPGFTLISLSPPSPSPEATLPENNQLLMLTDLDLNDASKLKSFGVNASTLIRAGFKISELLKAGCTRSELSNLSSSSPLSPETSLPSSSSFGIVWEETLQNLKLENISADVLVKAGFKVKELQASGYI